MTAPRRFFLTIAAIVRNEGRYLAEWIEFHTLGGVEHFYIYDNDSSDGTAEILRPYVLQGRVTLLHWPEHPGQSSAYNHAIAVFGRDSDWMALIDVDEFIATPAGSSIARCVESVGREADQILLPWWHFGSSGHDSRPGGLVIENYVHRTVEAHRQTKTIVRPNAVRIVGVHHCETREGRTVDSAGNPALERWIQPAPVAGEMRIHHYFTKSRAEFADKIARGQADGGSGKTIADFERFATPVKDDHLVAMAGAVHRAIAESAARPQRLALHAPWSAQSELAPSETWQRLVSRVVADLRGLLPAGASARYEIGLSHAWLQDVQLPVSDVLAAWRWLCTGLGASPIIDLAGAPLPSDLRVRDPHGPLRPFLLWSGHSAGPCELLVLVEGRDAGGKAWRQQRSFPVHPGGTLAFLILSERTMTVERVTIAEGEPAGTLSCTAAVAGFV